MKTLLLFFSWLLFSNYTIAQSFDTTGSAALYQQVMKEINSKHKTWVNTTARSMVEKQQTESHVRVAASKWAAANSLENGSIETLVFLTLMLVAKDAQNEMKEYLKKIKLVNEQKKALNNAIVYVNKNSESISREKLDTTKLLFKLLPSFLSKSKQTFSKSAKLLAIDSTANIWATLHAKNVTKEEVTNTIEKLKSDLSMLDFLKNKSQHNFTQNNQQKNRCYTAISNIMKTKHDTVKNSISNVRQNEKN